MDFICEPAIGSAGGLALMWKKGSFQVLNVFQSQRYVFLEVLFPDATETCVVENIYGPNDLASRVDFFMSISSILERGRSGIIMGGDFNATLNIGERRGGVEVDSGDAIFNQFMLDFHLIDLPLLNGTFTWCSTRNGGLWSRIDRWILNDVAILYLNGVTQSVEYWSISDHRPIFLSIGSKDFGPKPFTFFNYWLMEDGFRKLVEDWWNSVLYEGWAGYVLLQKLKGLRVRIGDWRKGRGTWGSEIVSRLEDKLKTIMGRMEVEGVSEELRKERLSTLSSLWKEYR